MEQIFPKNLDELDYSNKDDCIKKLEDYIRYMKERCEFMMQGLTPTGVMNRVKMNGIDAGIISTGVLQSQDGQTFVLDLNNNTLDADFDSLKIGTKVAATQEYTDQAESDAKSYANSQDAVYWSNRSQQEVFDKLTNNRANQGIYISDGNLYINASAIHAGIISGIEFNNGNGTFRVDSSGNVTANSFSSSSANITGGTINIGTNSEEEDRIKLNYSVWSNSMEPLQNKLYNSSTLKSVTEQAGGIYFNSNNGTHQIASIGSYNNTVNPYLNFNYSGGSTGTLLENGSLTLKNTNGNTGAILTNGKLILNDSSGNLLTEIDYDGVSCVKIEGSDVVISHSGSNNNQWVEGASVSVTKSGWYVVRSRAKVLEDVAYVRYCVGIKTNNTIQTTNEMGSDASYFANQTIAGNGTSVEEVNVMYLASGTTLKSVALAKGAGGGSGGTSVTYITAMRIG